MGEVTDGVGVGSGSKEKSDGEGAIKERYWSTTYVIAHSAVISK